MCGDCAPRLVEGCFGLGLWRAPWVDGIGGGGCSGPWVACSSRSWGSFRIGETVWRFGQSSGMSELSSSDPQWSGGDGGMGKTGRAEGESLWGGCCVSSASCRAGPERPFLLIMAVLVLCGL